MAFAHVPAPAPALLLAGLLGALGSGLVLLAGTGASRGAGPVAAEAATASAVGPLALASGAPEVRSARPPGARTASEEAASARPADRPARTEHEHLAAWLAREEAAPGTLAARATLADGWSSRAEQVGFLRALLGVDPAAGVAALECVAGADERGDDEPEGLSVGAWALETLGTRARHEARAREALRRLITAARAPDRRRRAAADYARWAEAGALTELRATLVRLDDRLLEAGVRAALAGRTEPAAVALCEGLRGADGE